MSTTTPTDSHAVADEIRTRASEWFGVAAHPHRFAGVEFRLGTKELGHVHGDDQLDAPFTRRIRDVLVETGAADPHHLFPESGWVSLPLDGDAGAAVDLLRLSYCYHAAALQRRGDFPGLEDVDVAAALDELPGVDERARDLVRELLD